MPAMADGAVVAFAPLVFERNDFGLFGLLDDFGGHRGTGNGGRTHGDARRPGDEENFCEGCCLTFGDVEFFDFDDIAFGDAVLFTACLNHCVSHK